VILTAFASMSMPRSRARRASSSYEMSFDAIGFLLYSFPRRRPVPRPADPLDDC
jgi:hypothetical protein